MHSIGFNSKEWRVNDYLVEGDDPLRSRVNADAVSLRVQEQSDEAMLPDTHLLSQNATAFFRRPLAGALDIRDRVTCQVR